MKPKIKSTILIILVSIFMILNTQSTSAKFKIIINFDDGYKGVYNNAYSIMKKNNIKAVVFMPTNFINTKGHLTLEQLKKLKASNWEIGSHTIHHPDLRILTQQGLENEIISSKLYLARNNLLYPGFASFASPGGVWNDKIARIVKENYQIARGQKLFSSTKKDPIPTQIKVILTENSSTTVEKWLEKAYVKDKPIILVFHEIGVGPNQYFYPVNQFKEIINYIIENHKSDVVTFYNMV